MRTGTFLLFVGLLSQTGFSAEPICPGGSNPRADVFWCTDFSNLTHCQTGLEAQCWIDNGYTQAVSPSAHYTIKAGDGPTTTNTSAVGIAPPAGSGLGWAEQYFPSTLAAASLRWYVKFDHGYVHQVNDTGHHGPVFIMEQPGTCYGEIGLDYNGTYGIGWMSMNPGCAPQSSHFPGNLAPVTLTDNVWHIVEMQVVLDTACTDATQLHGCNGIWRAWFDGVKILEFTDYNFRSANPNIKITAMWLPRDEGPSMQAWGAREQVANVAVSNGPMIGRAANEVSLGTPDPGYYVDYNLYDGEVNHLLNGACNPIGSYLSISKDAAQWRSGATLESAITHGLYTGTCVSPGQDTAMQVQLTASPDGGGQVFERSDNAPQMAVHGWIYLPSGNDYSQPPALSGFTRYGADNAWSQYVAMTVAGGQWGIIQRPDAGIPQVVARAGAVTFDAWHEFEIILFNNNTASLMIDQNQIIRPTSLPMSAAWFWDGSNGLLWWSKMVIGVIDYRGPASAGAPFTAYYDDLDLASVSLWSCTGWNAASCPFSAAPPPGNTIAPAAPRGIQVL